VVVLVGDAFLELARAQAAALDFPDARLAVFEHPIAGTPEASVRAKGEALVSDVIAAFARQA
jgi:hypothetical protein